MRPAAALTDVPICIDGRMLGEGGTGVSTYARSLTRAVTALTAHPLVLHATPGSLAMRALRARLPGPHAIRRATAASGTILTARDVFRIAHVHFGRRRRLYRLRGDRPAGIMHWSYPVPIVMEGWTNIYTVHDTIPIDRPDLSPIDPHHHRAVLAAVAERADRIVTVSADARAAIIRHLDCAPGFVADAGQAVDVSDAAPAVAPGGSAAPYLLFVGSIDPRKNLSAILAAYRLSGLALPLLIAGPDGWHAAPILADIAATPGVRRLPYQARGAMLGLMRGARALVFPTLAEGFGLPVIEAMALGTPVLTSDRGALAEVAGDAALTVDPTDIAALARALSRIATDAALSARLIARGRARAAEFSPARFADRLAAIYNETLSGRDGGSNAPAR